MSRFTASFSTLAPLHPSFAAGLVLGLASVMAVFFWWQQRAPGVTSNALLTRAESWDAASLATNQGVIFQTIRITMTQRAEQQTITRSIYRDVQRKRQPRQVRLDTREEQLRSKLTRVGLDWDEPLSAVVYQRWRDRQPARADSVVRNGRHLLRLTTTVPAGPVAEQSLTVRDTDFHPVGRTLALRDHETVEIAEVDFKILPWSAVDAGVFEPIESPVTLAASGPAHVLSLPHSADPLSEGQLDEVELGARLMLNQLHADAGEQIEIHRTTHGVAVDGLVETDAQRRELLTRLRTVPHLTASIQSVENLKVHPSSPDATTSVRMASMPDQPSPLKTYLEGQGRTVADINILAHQLFNNALTISQESEAIAALQQHFGSGEHRTVIASATLSDLIYSHRERLEAALKREREQLFEARKAPSAGSQSDSAKPVSFAQAAAKNLALSKELTQTNSPAVRSAEEILAEMSATMNDLAAAMHQAYAKPQESSSLSGKK